MIPVHCPQCGSYDSIRQEHLGTEYPENAIIYACNCCLLKFNLFDRDEYVQLVSLIFDIKKDVANFKKNIKEQSEVRKSNALP